MADDYQGVLDLDPNHTIYSGNDYIPAEYFRILNDPDRDITVYLLDGKIVGAINIFRTCINNLSVNQLIERYTCMLR